MKGEHKQKQTGIRVHVDLDDPHASRQHDKIHSADPAIWSTKSRHQSRVSILGICFAQRDGITLNFYRSNALPPPSLSRPLSDAPPRPFAPARASATHFLQYSSCRKVREVRSGSFVSLEAWILSKDARAPTCPLVLFLLVCVDGGAVLKSRSIFNGKSFNYLLKTCLVQRF